MRLASGVSLKSQAMASQFGCKRREICRQKHSAYSCFFSWSSTFSPSPRSLQYIKEESKSERAILRDRCMHIDLSYRADKTKWRYAPPFFFSSSFFFFFEREKESFPDHPSPHPAVPIHSFIRFVDLDRATENVLTPRPV